MSSVINWFDIPVVDFERAVKFYEAVLGVKLRYLDTWTAGRRRVAARYDSLLPDFQKPLIPDHVMHCRHVYPVFVHERDTVRAFLEKSGVGVNVHYPIPCHLQEGYKNLGYANGAFPHTERLASTELSLPIYPELTDEQIDIVVETLQQAVSVPA